MGPAWAKAVSLKIYLIRFDNKGLSGSWDLFKIIRQKKEGENEASQCKQKYNL